MNLKSWQVNNLDKQEAVNIADKYGLPHILAMLLQIRGATTTEEIQSLIGDNEFEESPFDIIDMEKAVNRIKRAINDFERIAVYGDYDADGVTATAILYSYLETVGADVMFYIPKREGEGYGMNSSAIDFLHEQDVKLIVTVDNGISSIDETEHANSLGIDVIITDHHIPHDILPNAFAVVDPHRKDCASKYKAFCGAGIALKMVMALEWEDGDPEYAFSNYVDLAALGTIADVVSLKGENRVIVKQGLEMLCESERLGIRALLDKIELNNINSQSVAYNIVPRINASGRMGDADRAVRLLCTEDSEEAVLFAEDIFNDNEDRKNIENEIEKSAIEAIESDDKIKYSRVIIVSGDDWHRGVIGIVASKLCEKYSKPVIVISFDSDGNGAGSGRSYSGFSLFDCISACSSKLIRFGGHTVAAGLSIEKANLADFIAEVDEYTKREYNLMPAKKLDLDCKLVPSALNVKIIEQLKDLEPFGTDNQQPTFGLFNMTLNAITPVGGGNHLRLSFVRDKITVNCMKFFCTAESFPYSVGTNLDLAVTLNENQFKGVLNLSIIIKEMKPSNVDIDDAIMTYSLYEKYRRHERLAKHEIDTIMPTREDFAALYRALRGKNGWDKGYLEMLTIFSPTDKFNLGKLMISLEVLSEQKLIEYTGEDVINIKLLPTNGKTDIMSSVIIKTLCGLRMA